MSQPPVDRLEPLGGVDPHRLGMLLFIASEAFFFGALIMTFLFYRGLWARGPASPAAELDIGLTGLFSALLLASSGTIWLAERGLRDGRRAAMRLWLLATLLLGGIFLGGQLFEYADLIHAGITISSGHFGTTFFTLTGFHGLHVFGGLVALAVLLGAAQAGAGRGRHWAALDSVSLYWHFVDVVWIAVFSIVYVWTVLS
jgi:heme/copper-type cytochrome/quinol oxidase subunit 3